MYVYLCNIYSNCDCIYALHVQPASARVVSQPVRYELRRRLLPSSLRCTQLCPAPSHNPEQSLHRTRSTNPTQTFSRAVQPLRHEESALHSRARFALSGRRSADGALKAPGRSTVKTAPLSAAGCSDLGRNGRALGLARNARWTTLPSLENNIETLFSSVLHVDTFRHYIRRVYTCVYNTESDMRYLLTLYQILFDTVLRASARIRAHSKRKMDHSVDSSGRQC